MTRGFRIVWAGGSQNQQIVHASNYRIENGALVFLDEEGVPFLTIADRQWKSVETR